MLRVVDGLSRLAGVIAGGILVGMTGMILYEILLRAAFSTSTYVLDEFVGYGVAAMTFLSLAMALKDGVFIRVHFVLANVGQVPRRWIETVSHLVGLGLFVFVGLFVGRFAWRDFSRGTVGNSIAEVPLWIPQTVVLIGVVVLILQFAVLTVHFARGGAIRDAREEM